MGVEERYPNQDLRVYSPKVEQGWVGALVVHKDQELDKDSYLSLLADRLQELLEKEGNPREAFDLLQNLLDDQGFLDNRVKWNREAAHQLIEENHSLQGLLVRLLPDSNPRLHRLKDRKSQLEFLSRPLEEWVNDLLPPDDHLS